MDNNSASKLVDRPTVMGDGIRSNVIDSQSVSEKKTGLHSKAIFKLRLVITHSSKIHESELKETNTPVSRFPVVSSVLAIINTT